MQRVAHIRPNGRGRCLPWIWFVLHRGRRQGRAQSRPAETGVSLFRLTLSVTLPDGRVTTSPGARTGGKRKVGPFAPQTQRVDQPQETPGDYISFHLISPGGLNLYENLGDTR